MSEPPLERARKAAWAMLHADDGGVISTSADGLATRVTIFVEVFGAFGLTVSEKETETLVTRMKEKKPSLPPRPAPPLVVEAARQQHAQTTEFRCLGGLVNVHGDLTREIKYTIKAEWACFRRYIRDLFDRPGAPFRL